MHCAAKLSTQCNDQLHSLSSALPVICRFQSANQFVTLIQSARSLKVHKRTINTDRQIQCNIYILELILSIIPDIHIPNVSNILLPACDSDRSSSHFFQYSAINTAAL